MRHTSLTPGCANAAALRAAERAAPAGRSRLIRLGRSLTGVGVWACICGCTCEREERKPYTPFGVASSLPTAPAPRDAAPASQPQSRFEHLAATRHEPPVSALAFQGASFEAPTNTQFEQTLAADLDGDERPELVAWLRPEDASSQAQGSLWLFSEGKPGRRLEGFPGFVPTTPDCTHDVELERTGPASVTLDTAASCKQPLTSRLPTRALTVLAPLRAKPRLLQLRLAEPKPEENLELTVESRDRDSDGHDDVEIRLTMRAEETSRESSAELAWLERASGLSRQLAQTERSFADIGSVEVVRASGKTTSATVGARIANARRLFAYLCKASGTFGVTTAEGEALECGDLQQARNFYARAEVQAALTQGDFAAALWGLRRADWYGGKISDAERQKLQRHILDKLPTHEVVAREIGTRARAGSGAARYSPLSFSQGTLLILAAHEVWRYAGGELENATEEVDPWPLRVFGPEGQLLQGLSFPCNQATLLLQAKSREARLVEAARTPWLAPRPGYCSGSRAFDQPRLRAVRYDAEGLSALLDGMWVGPERAAGARGSPLSPNGRNWVASTELGLLLKLSKRFVLWRPKNHASLSDCVINNSGDAVACLRGQQVVLMQN